jgi:hypothetical protein
MTGTVTNPLEGLINGLLQGHQLAQQLHRQSLEDQAFRTQQALQNQQMSVQDIMTKMQLATSGAKALDQNGDYMATQQPSQIGSVSMPGYQYPVKPPAEQTADYGGKHYSLPTRDQLAQEDLARTLERTKGIGGVENTLAVDRMRQEMNLPIDIPGMGDVPRGALPVIERQATQQFQAGQGQLNRSSREKVAANALIGSNQRAKERNQAMLDAARIRKAPGADTGSGEATPTQLNSIEIRKQTALRRAESAYRNAMKAASAGNYTDPEKAREALDNLNRDKQGAQDNYESELNQFGLPVQHFEYSSAAAPVTGPKQTKTANAAQVAAYARQKNITPAQAAKEFQQFGYQVQ